MDRQLWSRERGADFISGDGNGDVPIFIQHARWPDLCELDSCTVNGVPQVATAEAVLSPEHTPWNDFHTISWAHYPDGFYDQLRAAGMDAIIAYVDDDFDPVLDNDFKFYVSRWPGRSSRSTTRISRNGGRC